MKIRNLPPIVFNTSIKTIIKSSQSISLLALTPDGELVIVSELFYPHLWQDFWNMKHKGIDEEDIDLSPNPNDDPERLSQIAKQLINGLNYIIAHDYLFIGILYLQGNVYDEKIVREGIFFKRSVKYFYDMHINYRKTKTTLKTESGSDCVEGRFLGQGEKFFYADKAKFNQFFKVTGAFKGSFCGILGIRDNNLDFMILSHNVTRNSTIPPLKLDKEGRDILRGLSKKKKFLPIAGFKLDYGYESLRSLPMWGSLELLPQYSKPLKYYQIYLKAKIKGEKNPFKIIEKGEIFAKPAQIELIIEGTTKNERVKSSDVENKNLLPSKTKTTIETTTTSKISLEKPAIPTANSTTLSNLEKPKLSSLKPIKPLKTLKPISKSVESEIEEGEDYEDIYNKPKTETFFDESGTMILDPSQMDETMMSEAFNALDNDFGMAIDPNLMSQDDIFRDLESSLDAMSKLDELAEKNESVSRIYYPPPTLISYANKEGMQIGGSTCIVSIGTGRNLWFVPEIKRMQMWGTFYKDLDGNPQIEDFIALEEKDIESLEQLEDILQKAFISIRKNNHLFLGLIHFEGNGFEKEAFDECALDWKEIEKLMEIHIQRRETTKFPELTSDSWIEVHYFGRERVIELLDDPESQGILEIADSLVKHPEYSQGTIAGIICVDEEAAYFFILSDDLDQVEKRVEERKFEINQDILKMMYESIEKMNLTPVSWFKMVLGIRSFEELDQWDELKESPVFEIILEKYQEYVNKILETKAKEDEIRKHLEEEFKKIQQK